MRSEPLCFQQLESFVSRIGLAVELLLSDIRRHMTNGKQNGVRPVATRKAPPAPNPRFHPISILRGLWKHRWLVASFCLLIGIGGTLVVLQMPSVYKAETLILVDSQRIPERYVATTVVSDLQERLSTISQQILSTSRLDKIILADNLYPEARKKYAQEEVIAMMRKDITVTVERSSANRLGAFRVSYQGENPVVVAKVANRLASLYIEENLRVREKEADQTDEFLGQELLESKAKLDDLEAKLSEYKRGHMGALPEQESGLTSRVTGIQVALQGNEDALNRNQQQVVILQNTLETRSLETRAKNTLDGASDPTDTDGDNTGGFGLAPAPVLKSEQLRATLAQLRLRYTDSHPDIRRLEDEIAAAEQAEKQTLATAAPVSSGKPLRTAHAPKRDVAGELRAAAIRSQIAQFHTEQNTLQAERSNLIAELASYQSRIELLPVREQEMASLTRDYETSKLNYTRLLDKGLDAKMAGKMEKLKKSENFTVLDEAKPPQKPIRPKREMLIAGAWVLGLCVGVGSAFLREFLNDVLLGEWELPEGVRVLGRVHEIEVGQSFQVGKLEPSVAIPSELSLT